MTDCVSAIPDDTLTQIGDALDTIRDAIEPHAVELSADERREVLKMGDRTLAFVEKAVRYGRERADLAPGFLDVDKMASDLATSRALEGLAERLCQLESLVRDTAMVAGSEAHEGSLVLYRAVKAAARAGAPGADVVRDDLGKRFARGPRTQPASEDGDTM